ncbi:MAG: glucose-1-phosphate adenylyltransferase [Synergistaceae bacterium]|jgi:glucose-1-phosphate adenylyltransferase|nr:glucose-1-phosphate adenylyltransferase [Synergistaceae bacterium]
MIHGRYGRVLAIVLAGGKGERLMPLTRYRAKPAVPFAAKYRIVDFALSNLVNSGIYSIYCLTQFKSQSLQEHITQGWQFGPALRGRNYFVNVAPAQMWTDERWYEGTADAIYQNLHLLTMFNADYVCIFAADHIYKMDIEQMLAYHVENDADITIAANRVPSSEATQFGCISADERGVINGFVEKPANPPEIKSSPGYSYVSMGNYIFSRETLEEAILTDSTRKDSTHDFGKDILPKIYTECKMMAYDFSTNVLPGNDKPYWKDVGTLKAYWEAHMDLLQQHSALTLYNSQWPVRTVSFSDPPGFTYPAKGMSSSVEGCLRAEASQVLGAVVHRCVLSRHCIINAGTVMEESIIGQGVVIGENCKLRRVIVDAHNVIPPNTVIGYNTDNDAESYFLDKESGLVVVPMPKIQLRKNLQMPDNSRYDDDMGFTAF